MSTQFKKILLPLDGSPLSERAIEPAISIGRRSNSEIILARAPIVDLALAAAPDRSSDQLHTDVANYLSEVQLTHASPYLKFHLQTMIGDPAAAIINTAINEHADLIVMSTHGYSGLARLMLGSVTEKVLRSAPCPVLAIRAAQPIQRIVIPLDGSPLAERALAPGLEIADRIGAEVTLLRAVERRSVSIDLDQTERGLGQRVQNDLIDDAIEYLADRQKGCGYPDLKIKSTVRTGGAAENILDFVEANHADLIVMATHGHTGLSRQVYGRVTANVLHHAPCSLMIIRAPGPELN